MIEIILLLGLLFVLGVVGLLHFAATADIPMITHISGIEPDPSLHPWFLAIETIVICCGIYILQNLLM